MDHQPANGRRLVKVNLTRSQMDTPGLNTTNYPTGIIQFSPCGLMDGSNGKIQCTRGVQSNWVIMVSSGSFNTKP